MILLTSFVLSGIALLEPERTRGFDLPIESSFESYRQLLPKNSPQDHNVRRAQDDPLAEVISWGIRMEDWYRQLDNTPILRKARTPGTAPSIEKPWRYSPKTILEDFELFKTQVDPKVKQILESKEAFPKELPVQRYLMDWFRSRISYISSVAIRWNFMLGQRSQMIQKANQDVRGYVFLNKEPNLRFNLIMWNGQTVEKKKELQFWLVNQCRNATQDPIACTLEFNKEILEKGNPLRLYDLYKNSAQQTYQNFFRIHNTHPDLLFETVMPNISLFQMLAPEEKDKAEWFMQTIAKYYNIGKWGLLLDYRNPEMLKRPTKLFFKPGILAHTNGIAGTEIHLDSNIYDLEPYVAAHELGHILGFKDCYIEFFDLFNEEMVYYAIDSNNIMCSQSGSFQTQHLDELRQAYAIR